jgi:hypothetical protein
MASDTPRMPDRYDEWLSTEPDSEEAEQMTPAMKLRAAAKLMRERAEAATEGPWRPVAGIWQDETFAAVIGPKGIPGDAGTWLMATGHGGASEEANADHAAGMHPGVALAVADWLDEVADDRHPELPAWVESGALTVARAYLGTEGSADDG